MTIEERVSHIQKQCDEINRIIAEIYKTLVGKDLTLTCRLCGERRHWKEIVEGSGDCAMCALQHANKQD